MDAARIKERISKLERIIRESPHADTVRDARVQADALRAKLPEGEQRQNFKDTADNEAPRWAQPPPGRDWFWQRFTQAQQEAMARYQSPFHDTFERDEYTLEDEPLHGLTPDELDKLWEKTGGLGAMGTFKAEDNIESQRASQETLRELHTKEGAHDYLNRLRSEPPRRGPNFRAYGKIFRP